MKKLLILTVLFAFLIGGLAYATETRVMTMGDVNNIVKDDANTLLYPSTINYYPNIFVGEFGNDTTFFPLKLYGEDAFYKAGANFMINPESKSPWVVGANFSTEDYFPDILYWWYYDKSAQIPTNNRISLTLGTMLSDMPFGFNFNYYNASAKNQDVDTSNNYTNAFSAYEFTFGLSPMEKKLDLAVGVKLTTWTDKYDQAYKMLIDESKPKGNMAVHFNGRYWSDPMGKWVLVPHLMVSYEKQGLEEYNFDQTLYETVTFKYFDTDLGLGTNYEASENVLVVTDFGFMLSSRKNTYEYADNAAANSEDKYSFVTLPYFKTGIDATVNKWLNFRAGVVTQWLMDKTEEPSGTNKYTEKYAVTQTFLGAGCHWGDFMIDAAVNPDFLTAGPYFISGDATSGPSGLSTQVSLLYNFNK